MKTAIQMTMGKRASLFKAVAPIVNQGQDERFRQILREELQAHNTQSKQPSVKTKRAFSFPFGFIEGFSDELQKMAQLTLGSVAPKPTIPSQITSSIPRNSMSAKKPNYSQINPASAPGPAQMHQPLLNPPPVRG